MTDRPNTALLVIDMQRDVVREAFDLGRVLANINSLVDRARAENVPVVWVQHADDDLPQGSEGWQYVSELTRDDDEPLVHKHYGDSFEETDLDTLLAERGVGRVVITGAQTDACIRWTLHGAFVRGYDTTLVEDAHTTDDMRAWGSSVSPEQAIAHTNMYWNWSRGPGRRGRTIATADIDFAS